MHHFGTITSFANDPFRFVYSLRLALVASSGSPGPVLKSPYALVIMSEIHKYKSEG